MNGIKIMDGWILEWCFIDVAVLLLAVGASVAMTIANPVNMTVGSMRLCECPECLGPITSEYVLNRTAPVVNLACPQVPTAPAPIISLSCPEPRPVPQFVEEAMLVAGANNYTAGYYDCTQFSKELFRRYENDGYNAMYCRGYAKWCPDYPDNKDRKCRHEWVKLADTVVVEPTTGIFITPKEYKELYEEKYCWSYIPDFDWM